MKVIVSVHGRFHAFELSSGLYERGHLQQLITTYPSFYVKKLTNYSLPVRSVPRLELLKRIIDRTGLGTHLDGFIGEAFGNFACRTDMTGADIFVGWANATLEAIKTARSAGLKIVLERGSSHICHQTEILKSAYEKFGSTKIITPQKVIERELEEYELVDAISVPSSYAAQTFIQRGFSESKIIKNNLGVNLSLFGKSPHHIRKDCQKILFVGRIGIRKGIPNLLAAFSELRTEANLHLIGPVETGFENYLRNAPLDKVILRGPINFNQLPAEYDDADIFCLPSLEEGFPLVILQALASGCPVITTEAAGAADIIKDGVNGIILPDNSPPNITKALRRLLKNPELRSNMSITAKESVLDGFSWNHYVDRAIMAYEKLQFKTL